MLGPFKYWLTTELFYFVFLEKEMLTKIIFSRVLFLKCTSFLQGDAVPEKQDPHQPLPHLHPGQHLLDPHSHHFLGTQAQTSHHFLGTQVGISHHFLGTLANTSWALR
jgi:hypothetical protein